MTDRTPTGDLRERLVSALHQCFAGQGDSGRIHMYDPESGECTPCEGRAAAVLPVFEAETAAKDAEIKRLGEAVDADGGRIHRLRVELAELTQRAEEAERQRDDALAERDDYATRLRLADAAYRELLGEVDEQRRRAVEALAAIQRVRRLQEMTIASSCRAGAIEQAEDTLRLLDQPKEEP